MISPDVFSFLTDLAENNQREWFDENRKRYQASKKHIETAVNDLISGISVFDTEVSGLEAKKCMFRIFRDVRFSKNKEPYKTNMGAWMAKGGRKSVFAGYYLHLQPGESFLAGGVYHPMGPVLKSIREGIDYDADSLRKILARPAFKNLFGELQGDKVKTSPRGYAKDHPDIDLLRHKDFLMVHKVSDQELIRHGFLKQALEIFTEMKPLNDYLNQSIAEMEN